MKAKTGLVFDKKQCRNRWYNYGNPDLDMEPLTLDEKNFIIQQKKKGWKSKDIRMEFFPKKSSHAIVTAYHQHRPKEADHQEEIEEDSWNDIQIAQLSAAVQALGIEGAWRAIAEQVDDKDVDQCYVYWHKHKVSH